MTPEQISIFRAMSPARKLELAAWFNDSARRLKAQALRAQHPDWPDDRIARRVRELFLYASN
jgi:hypothetical protein